jgi:hypothetical protein
MGISKFLYIPMYLNVEKYGVDGHSEFLQRPEGIKKC